ncbi:MAG: type II toxin-antitoxin system RelE/ParE family toxin [Acidobacteriota bacterium]
MIKSFRHKGLEAFFRTGSKSGIQPHNAGKLQLILTLLHRARGPADVSGPGLFLHPLGGKQAGFLSVRVSGNWRVVFRFDGTDVELVDYLDYH